ncbi:unnamed protein product [Ixodes pacificus]
MVVVTCGNRLETTMINLKSVLAFSTADIRLILFADVDNIQRLQDMIQGWPAIFLERVDYELRLIRIPKRPDIFKRCDYQRMFLPSVLPKEDAVLYVDSDIMFLHPVEDLWKYFGEMNDQQLTFMVSDVEDPSLSLYFHRQRKMPRYGRYGLNSGVMLMNLTRMREFGLEARLVGLADEYRNDLEYRDQDLFNIVLHDHPDRVFVGPCRWNFIHGVCWSKLACQDEIPAIVHGTENTFFDPLKEKAYGAIGSAMQQYELGTSLERNFVDVLERNLRSVGTTLCAEKFRHFVKHWRKLARQVDADRGWSTL